MGCFSCYYFSALVGILAHNTWQAEQDAVQKEIQGEGLDQLLQPQLQPQLQAGKLAKQKPASRADKARMESDAQIEQDTQARTRAKKKITSDNSKDSRKLLYKSAPVPVMQSAPAYFESTNSKSLLEEKRVHQLNDSHEEIQASPEVELKKAQMNHLSKQQMEFNKISQFIENNEITEAQKLLLQFKTKYPDYPIDPVILKRLSPY
ncbi:MAG: hypothetical protein KZQ56_10340 [gamma proteobacterium symbiont of Lucinoma myriamae]|nr:hypothetical protein [gamma proteobacterium symbiont of Lucinoma myriamae]